MGHIKRARNYGSTQNHWSTATTEFPVSKRNKMNSKSLAYTNRKQKKKTPKKQEGDLETYETKPDEEPIDLKIGFSNANDEEILDEIFDHTQLKVP